MRHILNTARSITLTPIAKPVSPKESRRDYDIVSQDEKNGFDATWDDSSSNDSRIGDLFGFVHGAGSHTEGDVEIRRIVAILPTAYRARHWTMEKHKERQVLVLSETKARMTWKDFLQYTGRKCTGRVDKDGSVRTPPLQGTKRWSI